jgi:hypothetical protein
MPFFFTLVNKNEFHDEELDIAVKQITHMTRQPTHEKHTHNY